MKYTNREANHHLIRYIQQKKKTKNIKNPELNGKKADRSVNMIIYSTTKIISIRRNNVYEEFPYAIL